MQRDIFEQDHNIFRESFRQFCQSEIVPHQEKWLEQGQVTPEEACMAKYWTTDLLNKVVDDGVQLHGGYGYMQEYPICRAYTDARITRIFVGTNEIMKEVIGRGMGL